MRVGLMTVLVIGLLFCGALNAYAQQAVVLDPVVSYEIYGGELFSIPIGATFKELVGDPNFYDLFVAGLPVGLEPRINKISPFRISGGLYPTKPIDPGTYFITLTARDHVSGASASATMQLKISPSRNINNPILFDPLEQIKVLKLNTWYSIAIGVRDSDMEELILSVTGAANNALGYAVYTQTELTPGRVGGVLNLKMARPGELKINLVARDKRQPGVGASNQSVAELHFLVTQ